MSGNVSRQAAANKFARLQGETVLLTGASGFLGRHVLPQLLSAGAEVLAVSRTRMTDETAIRWLHLPAWTPEALKARIGGEAWTCVIHAAAHGVAPSERSAEEMANMNVSCAAMLACLAAERKAKGYVHVGSCSEYEAASTQNLLTPQSPLETHKLYGASKAAGTLISHAIMSSASLPFAGARLFNLYGPGEAGHRLLPTLLGKLLKGQSVPLSAGLQVRDFCYVTDAAQAIVTMLASLAHGSGTSGVYNVCSGAGRSIKEFALCVADSTGSPRSLLDFGALPLRPDDVLYVVGDPSRTQSAFGWSVTTPLEEGIASSFKAFRDQMQERKNDCK